MTGAKYVYCIVASDGSQIEAVGLDEAPVEAISYKDISAIASPVAFKELESNIAHIMTHQKVVELAREKTTTLPVRFGVIFKNRAGVIGFLTSSYKDYKSKLSKFNGKDEFGVKLILTNEALKKVRDDLTAESSEIGKLEKEVAKAGKGTAYMLKLKLDEALRTETFKKLDVLTKRAYEELSGAAAGDVRLKSDHEQILLNSAFLVERETDKKFKEVVERVTKEVRQVGLELHLSGPWAPYSFLQE